LKERISRMTDMATPHSLDELSDDAFQDHLLQGVSRTFALTIPRLPEGLARPVANAYLLCRIVDTIEDEVGLDLESKRRFCREFSEVVRGRASPEQLRDQLGPKLSNSTLPAEHELIKVLPRVIQITHGFAAPQQDALGLCVEIMAEGMAQFQGLDLKKGLPTLKDHDRYCYVVAGVVGEMLTRLFCHYSEEIRAHESEMMRLAVSFGQGLQMTNILKDLWDDHDRGVCWLPQDVFDRTGGFALETLKPGHNDAHFKAGFQELIGVAHGHLKNALRYTLLIPAHEKGMREFCLWALGMAILTLRKIAHHPDFSTSSEVKITRKAVKTTIITSRLFRSSDWGLKTAFALAGRGVPLIEQAA
jgi:farnesyl-diphosphate farnesyltransferase